jgi:hypothetical protein
MKGIHRRISFSPGGDNMKLREMVAICAVLFSSSAAFAGIPPVDAVPEPASVVVWGAVLGIGGILWLWKGKRR